MATNGALPEPTTDELRDIKEVAQLMLVLAETLQQGFSAMAAQFGLTAAQAKLLLNLAPGEALPMRALAERLDCDASNLTGLVDRLEARGAVRRQADPADRRIKVLVITDEGCRVRDNFWSGMVASAGPFAQLSGRQVRQLRDLLRSVAPATH